VRPAVRPVVVPMKKQHQRRVREENAQEELDHWRPATRADCLRLPRPCPYVGCRYHLFLDVHPRTGSIKLNRGDQEVWECDDLCLLDLIDEYKTLTLDQIGHLMNITRERVRQLEESGLKKLKASQADTEWHEPVGKVHYYCPVIK